MRIKWIPWRYVIRRLALAHGFLDPISLMSRLNLFAQPSEVTEPIELLRAGLVFHARGLLNTRAIQHNLDWIWPYWVERQFDPDDESFIPRAFSITHVNLTHRNWTAVGVPGCLAMPLVDPRGLLTPHWDGWSIDAWIVTSPRHGLFPSRSIESVQTLSMQDNLAVTTKSSSDGLHINLSVDTVYEQEAPLCRLRCNFSSSMPAWAVITLRPYNPEGVSFINEIALTNDRMAWLVDNEYIVRFITRPDRFLFSDYRRGDVFMQIPNEGAESSVKCPVGMATSAAVFELSAKATREVTVEIPLRKEEKAFPTQGGAVSTWHEALEGSCVMQIPDAHFQFLYDSAVRTLILLSPGDVYPGPYTYKRFWFRDAAFILNAIIVLGLKERAGSIIDRFRSRQTRKGYFLSQEGEWDSNGAALWIMQRYCELTGRHPKPEWLSSIHAAARWIEKKRLPEQPVSPHSGLLPPGFSAEHLGPNDYYYWDDFLSVAGLRAASAMTTGDNRDRSDSYARSAESLMCSIDKSLAATAPVHGEGQIPASPYRRMDAGAIGSVVASYPLELWPENDARILGTVKFLMENCFVRGAFFQDMIHSGLNAYLTLHVAQVLLRAGDRRYLDLVRVVADLASPTGQWPEAIHARTRGGCMGDGQHAWASAEWVMMLRNMFVRETSDGLVIGSGIPAEWLAWNQPNEPPLSFGPTLTRYGAISIVIRPGRDRIRVEWKFATTPVTPVTPVRLMISIPGFSVLQASSADSGVDLARTGAPGIGSSDDQTLP